MVTCTTVFSGAVEIPAGSLIGWKAWRHEPTDAAFIFSSTLPTCGSCHMLLTKEDILVEQAGENLSGMLPSLGGEWLG